MALLNGHANGAESDDADHNPYPNIYTASSVEDIRTTLSELSRREAAITSSLDTFLATQKDLARTMSRLDLARAQVGAQVVHTRNISNGLLASASTTAHRISSAVRNLDREQAAVKSTLKVVEQVADLKACVLAVTGSMGAPQDWETAASYLHRASQIPDAVIDSPFAEEAVPTADVPDVPRHTLNAASESLCALFLREFDKAARDGDGARVTRFFKLFPLIGRSQVGLEAYGRYVCSGVASRARSTLNTGSGNAQPLFYANALTKLFEHIAQIVDGHEPLVERHYGSGSMTKVIERIQMEADVQGGIILDTWAEERRVNRKLTDVKAYPYNFLVQSFVPSSKPSLSSTPRTASPALGNSTASAVRADDDAVDMKEVDALLNESAVMLGRWSLYARFIATKTATPTEGEKLQMPPFVANSTLAKKALGHLVEPFNALATFFFRRSVERAFQMDEAPSDLTLNPNKTLASGGGPYITSAVDDVMYILNQALQRTLSTRSKGIISSVVPSFGRVLGGDFFGMIQRKMRDESYPRAVIQNALPPENTIIAFLVLMNNLDVATNYVKRIIRTCLGPDPAATLTETFPFGNDAQAVEKTFHGMESGFEAKTTELINEAVEVMLQHVMRPRLRPVLVEAFRDVEYLIEGEDATHAAESEHDDHDGDAVAHRFDRGWHAFTSPIKRITTPAIYDKLLAATVTYLARTLEKRIWSYYERVNALGAVRLERDVAGIVAAAVKGGKYELRDAFAKCTQMILVLNMEEDEWEEVSKLSGKELERATGVQWKLDEGERRRVRALLKK